jgi:hypothetical protein
MWQSFCRYPAVKWLASLKLAVCVIALMTVMMVWGTLVESNHGAEYAKAAVYFSPPFIATEIFLFLNILFAALVRLPPKKRLIGFYVVHSGLLLILAGAGITAFKGVDGSLELVPGEPVRYVRIDKPQLHVLLQEAGKKDVRTSSKPMPRVAGKFDAAGEVFLSLGDYDVTVKEYFPFATPKSSWVDDAPGAPPSMTLWLTLANENVRQAISLSSERVETGRQQMGPLTLELMPEVSSGCFSKGLADDKANYLFVTAGKCLPVPKLGVDGEFAIEGVAFKRETKKNFLKIVVTDGEWKGNFYPDMTPFPITDDIEILDKSGMRLIDLNAVRNAAHVIFFADRKFSAGKGSEWEFTALDASTEQTLPWMEFKMTIDRSVFGRHEKIDWEYAPPLSGDDGGRGRAALVEVTRRGHPESAVTARIDSANPATLALPNGAKIQMLIGPKMTKLPFDLELTRFKMDMNPGTNDPASFESFVNVKSGDASERAHIFMNHPLKTSGFTFYQASYFQLENGEYGSVLSVNRDPGRPMKYAGSLFLVVGCVAHYALRSRRAAPGG